jgi:DNA-binding NarL/FixJ family response regulator
MTDPAVIRVLLVDDHTMLREGLRRSLELEGLTIVGEASDGLEAVRVATMLKPDVVLMDVTMPAMDGIEATKAVRDQLPDTQVVMLTMHDDADVIQRSIRAGAAGYVTKDSSSAEVADAVRLAAAGETALSPSLAGGFLQEVQDETQEPVISKREEEVLQVIADGASTAEAAERLFISAKTVKNHLASIYQKLEARDRTQAVLRAARMGIIRLSDVPSGAAK